MTGGDASPPDEPRDPLVGRTVAGGRYTITAVLGRGGMGIVYAAVQHPVNRKVALKLIHRELAGERHIVERFMQEMNLTAAVEHPHTVRLYDVGDLDGQPFITTEFLEGRTLREELARVGRLPPARAVAIALQIARALRGAQSHGIVHRDLKPDNIMLLDRYGERDYVKVLDFGIARSLHRTAADVRTGTGAIMGTPQYMSPEQCEGKPVDGRSDLYALGLVIYELVAGALPFPPSPSVPRMLIAHLNDVPEDLRARAPHAPPELVRLVMSMLSKSPADRPADAEAVIAALERLPGATRETGADAATAPTLAPPAPSAPGSTSPVAGAATQATPRRSGLAIAVGLVAVLAAVGAVVALRKPGPDPNTAGPVRAPSDEPAFPAACDPALARQLADARRPGLVDAEVRDRLAAIVAACPSSAVARALLGTALTRHDRDAEAEPHLRAALSLAPDYASARHNLAVLLVKRGQSVEALPLLDAVLTRDPGHATARLVRAQARLATGDAAGAVEDLRAQTALRPDHGAGWALLGEALVRTGDAAGAREAACRAVKLGVATARERCGPGAPAP